MKRNLRIRALFFSFISAGTIGASEVFPTFTGDQGDQENLNTALNDAIVEGRAREAEDLIKREANVNAITKRNKQTPLILVARQGKRFDKQLALIIKTLLDYRAEPKAQDVWGMTALMWAARNGLTNVLEALLQDRQVIQTINERDKQEGNTALIHAVRDSGGIRPYDFAKVVITLLLNGADPNIQNNLGKTALDYATASNQLLTMCLLKADPKMIRDPRARKDLSDKHPYRIRKKLKH